MIPIMYCNGMQLASPLNAMDKHGFLGIREAQYFEVPGIEVCSPGPILIEKNLVTVPDTKSSVIMRVRSLGSSI